MDSNERWELPTVVTKCQIKSDRNVACTPGRDEQAGFCLFMLNDWIFELNGNTVTTLKMCVTVGTGVCAKIASEIHVTCKWDDHENHLDILMLIANSLNAGSMQVFKKKRHESRRYLPTYEWPGSLYMVYDMSHCFETDLSAGYSVW